jgi:hypothetical protein
MNARFSNRLDMLKVVKSICDNATNEISSINELGNAYTQFNSMLSDIDQIINAQIAIITGVAIDKFNARFEVVKMANAVAQVLQAYAFDKKDNTLEKAVNLSVSKAMRMGGELLIHKCNIIYGEGMDHLGELGNYGLTPPDITGFGDALTKFVNISHAPDIYREERKKNTKNLYSLMAEIIKLLDRKVDRLVNILPDTHKDFKQTFVNARNIIDRHGKSRSVIELAGTGIIEGRVCCAYDSSPVEGALVYLIELDSVVETDEDGDYYFESVPAGKYTIEVLADTYERTCKKDVEVLNEAELTEDFDLEPEIHI